MSETRHEHPKIQHIGGPSPRCVRCLLPVKGKSRVILRNGDTVCDECWIGKRHQEKGANG